MNGDGINVFSELPSQMVGDGCPGASPAKAQYHIKVHSPLNAAGV